LVKRGRIVFSKRKTTGRTHEKMGVRGKRRTKQGSSAQRKGGFGQKKNQKKGILRVRRASRTPRRKDNALKEFSRVDAPNSQGEK